MLQLNVAYRLCVGVILYLLLILTIEGQQKEQVSLSIPDQKLNNLVQGRIYYPNYVGIDGSQYLTEDWHIGEVKLLGEVYKDLPLWYDIFTHDLILLDWKGIGYGMIKLNKEHIESFEFANRIFINPVYSSYKKYKLKNTFHEVVYEGDISFLIIRNLDKQRESNIDHFERKDSKILIHSDQTFTFRNKKGFLKAIPPNTKDSVSKYIKKNKLRLKNAKDSVWKKLVVLVNEMIQDKRGNQ